MASLTFADVAEVGRKGRVGGVVGRTHDEALAARILDRLDERSELAGQHHDGAPLNVAQPHDPALSDEVRTLEIPWPRDDGVKNDGAKNDGVKSIVFIAAC